MQSSLLPIAPLFLTIFPIANRQFNPKKKLSLLGLFTANGLSRRLSFDQCHSTESSPFVKFFFPLSRIVIVLYRHHRHHRQGKAIMKSISISLTSTHATGMFATGIRYIVMFATVFIQCRYNISIFPHFHIYAMQVQYFQFYAMQTLLQSRIPLAQAGGAMQGSPFNVLFVILYRFIQCNYSMQIQCFHFLFSPSFPLFSSISQSRLPACPPLTRSPLSHSRQSHSFQSHSSQASRQCHAIQDYSIQLCPPQSPRSHWV